MIEINSFVPKCWVSSYTSDNLFLEHLVHYYYNVTMLQYYNVIILQCYNLTILQGTELFSQELDGRSKHPAGKKWFTEREGVSTNLFIQVDQFQTVPVLLLNHLNAQTRTNVSQYR